MRKNDLIEDNLSKYILRYLLYLGISLFPIYIFGSGTIQISHFLLLLFSIIVFTKMTIQFDKYFFTFLIFLVYSFLVNTFYVYYDLNTYNYIEHFVGIEDKPNIKYLKQLLFLTYNFVLTISLLSFLNHQKKFKPVLYGLITAVLLILFLYLYKFYQGGIPFRFTGYFNNPNQLGYYSICSFSLIYLFYRNSYINFSLMIFITIIIILFSVSTLSKASYVSLIICAFFAIKPSNYRYSKIIEFIIILSLIFLFLLLFQEISEMNMFKRTLNMFNESDSSLSHRGYNVFFEGNSLQTIFGMGVKNVYKFHTYEIHSTLGMIFTSFGFIGFLVFLSLMIFWILDIKESYGFRGVICVCGPSLLYGLTHNGVRFTMFWIMFAVTISLSKNMIMQKKTERPLNYKKYSI